MQAGAFFGVRTLDYIICGK